jgi:hypothetical protein
MRSAHRLALMAILALCPVAHADTIFNFSATLDGVFERGYPPTSQATGTLTIDTVQGIVTGASIQTVGTSFFYVNDGGTTLGDYLVISVVNQNPPFPILPGTVFELNIFLPVSSLVGYTGGLGCSDTYELVPFVCPVSQIDLVEEVAGAETLSLTPAVIQTPELNSFVLLGTGLLGLAHQSAAGTDLRFRKDANTTPGQHRREIAVSWARLQGRLPYA